MHLLVYSEPMMSFTIGKESYRRQIFLMLFSAVGALLTLNHYARPAYPGLDFSWQWALNYSFSKHLKYGSDFLFSYGPLGFITHPQAVGDNLIISYCLNLSFQFFFIHSILSYIFNKNNANFKNRIVGLIISLAFIIFISNLYLSNHYIICYSILFGLLNYQNSDRHIFLILCGVLTGISLLLKLNTAATALSCVSSFLILRIFSNREYSGIISFIFSAFITFVSVWLILYGDMSNVLLYLKGIIEISSGYTTVMCYEQKIQPIFILLWVAINCFLYAIIRHKDWRIFVLVQILPTILIFKYTLCRQPGEHLKYFSSLFLIGLIIVFLNFTLKNGLRYLVYFLILLLIIDLGYSSPGKSYVYILNHLKVSDVMTRFRYVFNHESVVTSLQEQTKLNLRVSVLSQKVIDGINNRSCDSYPHELSFISANNLQWRNRPVIQSYSAYTPYLDKLNCNFIRSSEAPACILWNSSDGSIPPEIDERYLMNSEPDTIFSIFNNYEYVVRDDQVTVFQRNNLPVFEEKTELLNNVKISFNEWIDVPFQKEGLIRAHITYRKSKLDSILDKVYKDPIYYIDYMFNNGQVRRFRLSLRNSHGIWMNPFLNSLYMEKSAFKTISMRILSTANRNDDDILNISYTFNKYHRKPSNFRISENEHLKAILSAKYVPLSAPHSIDGINNLPVAEFEVEYGNLLNYQMCIQGWAIDLRNKRSPKMVFSIINNQYIIDDRLHERGDVSNHLKNMDYLESGFNLCFSGAYLNPGENYFSIYSLTNDGENYSLINSMRLILDPENKIIKANIEE